MMKDERFDAQELERVRVAAARHGRDEAEEQRLIDLGRRVEKLLATDPPKEFSAYFYSQQAWSGAWDWLRSVFLEDPHG